jgi:hypothetical protein
MCDSDRHARLIPSFLTWKQTRNFWAVVSGSDTLHYSIIGVGHAPKKSSVIVSHYCTVVPWICGANRYTEPTLNSSACCLSIHTTFACLAYSSDMSLADFPPGHFTYGRSDSDEPAVPEQKQQDNGAKNKAPAKKSTGVKPGKGANAADAFKSFLKITKKQPQSDDTAAGNKDPYNEHPSCKC